MASFETVAQQQRLKVRKAPYWRRLAVGQHIGIRKTEIGTHWQAKAYDSATQKEAVKSLGDFGHLPQNERYSAAVKAAQAWFDHLSKGGRRESITVAEAWVRYVERQREEKGEAAAKDVQSRFKRHVEHDPIAGLPVDKLASHHLKEWRARLNKRPTMPAKRGPNCRVKTPPKISKKSDATTNRDIVPMRAALNLALEDGYTTSDAAWRTALKPKKDVDGQRGLYLDRDQRRALIDALPQDAAAFVRGLCLLPLRPGALAALTVGNFSKQQGTLHIGTDKAGKGRIIPLPPATVEFFREQAMSKLPGAPLLSRRDGGAWTKDGWNAHIHAAALAAELPAEATAYTFRHSTISDLVRGGLDLFTAAKLSGTSVEMIEKHYGKLHDETAKAALAKLAL